MFQEPDVFQKHSQKVHEKIRDDYRAGKGVYPDVTRCEEYKKGWCCLDHRKCPGNDAEPACHSILD